MHFDLHEDSPISEYSRVEIYGLDYDTLITLSGTRNETFNNFVTPAGFTQYKLCRLRYTGTDLYKALSNTVPTDPELGGCVFNRKCCVEDIGGGYFQKDITLTPIANTQPDDWGTNIHYYRLKPETLTIDGTPSSAFLPEWIHLGDGFNPNDQYYLDESPADKRMARHFYFDSGVNVILVDAMAMDFGYTAIYTAGLWISYYKYKNGGAAPYCLNDGNSIIMANWNYDWAGQYQLDQNINKALTANVDENIVYIGITLTRNDVEYVGFALVKFSGGVDPYPVDIDITAVSRDMIADNVKGTGEIGQGSWGPTSDTGGGGGSFDDSSDDVGDGSATDTQNIQNDMQNAIADCVVTGFALHQLLTTSDYITPFYNVLFKTGAGSYLERFYQSAYDPTRAIVSLHKLPQKLIQYHGNPVISSHITAAGYDISQQMYTDSGGSLNVDFPELMPIGALHMDKIDLAAYYDAFPDFAPYTKCYLHLPYIGVQEIDINKIQYGSIQVSYYCEAITGNVSAHVWCNDRAGHHRYCYVCTGNAAYKLPVYSSGAGEGAISSGIAAIASAFSGNWAGAASAGINSALGAMQQSVQSSGNFGGSFGVLGDEVCWLEIVRPVWIQPDKYQKLRGLPSWVSGTIADPGDGSQLNGYTIIPYIDLDGVTGATDWEKQELARILAGGIEINGDL